MIAALRNFFFTPPAPPDESRVRGHLRVEGATEPGGSVPGLSSEDRILVNRIRAGDRDAFTSMVRSYASGLLTLAFAVLGTRDDAEDVVQDVLLRVWASHTGWSPRGPVRAYLAAAVRRRAVDVIRHRQVTLRNEPLIVLQRDEEIVGGPEDDARLWAAVASLDPRWREAISLRYVNQLGYEDVGRVLGVSADAARMTVKRAVRALRALLEE